MIRQREDKKWFAFCDSPGCGEMTDAYPTYTDIMILLMDKKWCFCDSKSPCYCHTCSGKFKEKKNPVCIAREGAFRDEHFFCSTIAKCPRVKKDDVCPAREHVLWQWQYQHHMTGLDVYIIHRTPEFLAACSRCLGEGELVDAEITKDDRMDLLEERLRRLEWRVKNEKENLDGSLAATEILYTKEIKKIEGKIEEIEKKMATFDHNENDIADEQIRISEAHKNAVHVLIGRINVLEDNWKKLSESFMFLAVLDKLPKERKI